MIRRQIFSRQLEINDEFKRISDERDEYKRLIDIREREQSKMDSKIRALEMIINTNNTFERTPISHHPLPPTSLPLPSSLSANRTNRVINNNPIGVSSSAGRATNSTASTSNGLQTPAHGSRTIGSITNSAAFNRFQTPLRNLQLINHNIGNRENEGRPVANRRQQRRSKSAEMWLDHKPPATPKTGK